MTQGPTNTPRAGRNSRERGVTLIEILVSLLLMSFGLLAMGAMQAWSVAGARTSGHRIVAALLASEVADMLRAYPSRLAGGEGDASPSMPDIPAEGDTSRARCRYPDCSPDMLAQQDLAALRARMRLELPQGELQVSPVAADGTSGVAEADLWIMWLEPRLYAHDDGGGKPVSREQSFDNCPPSAKDREPLPRCFHMRVAL